MKRTYTSKLFYGQYPYKITIICKIGTGNTGAGSSWTVHECRQWLNARSIDYKIYTSFGGHGRVRYRRGKALVLKCSLFLKSKDHFDLCLQKWPDDIASVVEPLAENHVTYLENNTTTSIRKKLIYGKFRYAVRFKYRYGLSYKDLQDWVIETYGDRTISDPPVKYRHDRYHPVLYLCDESDLMVAKLTWSDLIEIVTVVRTYDELHQPSQA